MPTRARRCWRSRATVPRLANTLRAVSMWRHRLGPTAARTAFAQELTRYTHDSHHGDQYTSVTGNALWREAWDANIDVLAADFLCLDGFPRITCCAAAFLEVERRLEEMSLFPPLPPEATKLDHTLQCIWTLGYDGDPIGVCDGRDGTTISLDIMPSMMGLGETMSTTDLGVCCAALYATQSYIELQPWRLTWAQQMQLPWSASGALLRDPPRASLGLESRTDEPDMPLNWAPQPVTIECSSGKDGASSRSQVVANIACRLFVLNLAWSTTEGELWEHLDSTFTGGRAVRSVVILRRADGRSRGIAKVVMRAPTDVVTAIEKLNGEHFGGRPLELSHDRLSPTSMPPRPAIGAIQ